ncbi:hypothetical protein ACLB2K_039960 [Fragaria x ananassa]
MAPSKKTMLFVCLLFSAVAVVVPVTQGTLGNLLKLIQVQGTVYCTANGNATVSSGGVNITSPPFRFAVVQLRCGPGNGTLVSTVITNLAGQFTIVLNTLQYTVAQLVSSCRVVVTTPLAMCNSTLSSNGTLTSNLTSNGTVRIGIVNVTLVTPISFSVSA